MSISRQLFTAILSMDSVERPASEVKKHQQAGQSASAVGYSSRYRADTGNSTRGILNSPWLHWRIKAAL